MPDLDAPRPVGIAIADLATGVSACHGVLAALFARERTGRGQRVETSLLQAGVSFTQEAASRYFTTGRVPDRQTRVRAAQVFAFTAGDGKPFVIHLSSPPKFWHGLTDAVGRPELRDDARFKDRPSRVEHHDALRETLADLFRAQPRETWLRRLQDRDVPCAPVHSLDEVFNDPQVRALGMPVTRAHPAMGEVRLSGSAVRMSETPVRYDLAPPLAGEHTDAVLRGLGYEPRDVERLRERNVI